MKMKNKSSGEVKWTRFLGKKVKIISSFVIAAVVVCIGLILLAMFSAPGGANTTYRPCGRIVIASDSKNANGFVSAAFERARYFLIYDLATKRFKAMANPYFNEMNPGAKAARFVADRSEEAIIVGNIGPVAYQTFENFNIHVYLVHKTSVRDAVRLFLEGGLVHVEPANRPGLMNAPAWGAQEPTQIQRVAWNPVFAQNPACPRVAYCPLCGFSMPLGAHIQTNRIMCPYCPGQIMQIMASAGQAQAPYQPGAVGAQQVGFWPGSGYGRGAASRGVCILR